MKRLIGFIALACLGLLSLQAQVDHTRELMNMVLQDDFFKAREYHRTHKEQLGADGELFYKYRMSYLSNKPDSAAIYLDNFITHYSDSFPVEYKINFCNLLISLYMETENYRKLSDMYEKVEQLIQMPPFNSTEYAEWQKKQFELLAEYKLDAQKKTDTPAMKIIRCNSGVERIKLTDKTFISATAEWNGIPLRTVFDTGSTFPVFISKKYADKCGFKELSPAIDSIPINNSMVRANYAMVDSIRIGSLLFTNVKAVVYHDDPVELLPDSVPLKAKQKRQYNSFFESCDAIIGLPLLNSVGRIQLDWEKNEMTMDLKSEVPDKKSEANIFLSEKRLFMGLSVNTIDYVGFVDTGNNYVCIGASYDFYKRNSAQIKLSHRTHKRGLAGFLNVDKDVRYKTLINPAVLCNEKKVSLKRLDDCIVWMDSAGLQYGYGQIGLPFFKRMGHKVSIDFVNMIIESDK